jgi:hypothetical protein
MNGVVRFLALALQIVAGFEHNRHYRAVKKFSNLVEACVRELSHDRCMALVHERGAQPGERTTPSGGTAVALRAQYGRG